jgi:hypothetical protein
MRALARHAHGDDDGSSTLCGRPRSAVKIDNADPTCRSCRRAIRSLCFDHGVKRCKVCPPGWHIGA